MRKFEFHREKFKRLVHYIIERCPDPAKLGSTKLHKILWKIDTQHFMLTGEPLTGAEYRKRPFGPAANALLPIRDELQKEGAIRLWRDESFAPNRPKDVYEIRQPADPSFLTDDQRQLVDYWVEEICLKHTADSISEETHGYAWEIAKMGDVLPVQSVLAERGREPEDEEWEWAKAAARKRGLVE